jgi:hypothetical protein
MKPKVAEKVKKLEVRGRGLQAQKREVIVEYRRKRVESEVQDLEKPHDDKPRDR